MEAEEDPEDLASSKSIAVRSSGGGDIDTRLWAAHVHSVDIALMVAAPSTTRTPQSATARSKPPKPHQEFAERKRWPEPTTGRSGAARPSDEALRAPTKRRASERPGGERPTDEDPRICRPPQWRVC